ncbi:MAG: hypothetical protein H5T85_08735, partial [Actinobacteria bacterium]|nr:hypothetical protein [Actinomycetota bacterium]
MKKQYVTDLKVGIPVDSCFVVARKEVKKKKNGEDFCSVTLQDKTGKIEAVIWTDVFKDIDSFSEGDFVLVKGDISEYKGGKQLIINSIGRIEDEKEIEYSDFIRTIKKDVGKMMSE